MWVPLLLVLGGLVVLVAGAPRLAALLAFLPFLLLLGAAWSSKSATLERGPSHDSTES